jgi:hypothetical protein
LHRVLIRVFDVLNLKLVVPLSLRRVVRARLNVL